jgi:hypothetical protein
MDLPEITIRDDDDVKLAVSTDEDPASRVLLVDVKGDDDKVHMSEIGIAPRNVERLKKQSSRSVMQYRSKDNALWIQGNGGRWTLRVSVPGQPSAELKLDEDETRALMGALFEPLP